MQKGSAGLLLILGALVFIAAIIASFYAGVYRGSYYATTHYLTRDQPVKVEYFSASVPYYYHILEKDYNSLIISTQDFDPYQSASASAGIGVFGRKKPVGMTLKEWLAINSTEKEDNEIYQNANPCTEGVKKLKKQLEQYMSYDDYGNYCNFTGVRDLKEVDIPAVRENKDGQAIEFTSQGRPGTPYTYTFFAKTDQLPVWFIYKKPVADDMTSADGGYEALKQSFSVR